PVGGETMCLHLRRRRGGLRCRLLAGDLLGRFLGRLLGTCALDALDDVRRHQGLVHFGSPAAGTGDLAALGLAIEGSAAGKPGLELVALLTFQAVADHEASLVSAGAARLISNGRSCRSDGMRWRALSTSSGLTSATMTPTCASASAITSPQGETMRL